MKLIKELGNKFANLYDNLTNADTSWENRSYDFYLIFGQTDESKSPWIATNWKSDFEPFFDLLINHIELSKDTGIRVTKYKPEKRISKKDNQEFVYHSELKLGRLKWDKKSHEKWTTIDNNENYFQNFELWTPIWTICKKRDIPPEIYITITNQRNFEDKRKIEFGYFILIAIAKNLNFDSKEIVRLLSEKINSIATIYKTRKWGRPEKFGNWTFLNWIQDTYMVLYKDCDLHTFDFDKIDFKPEWEEIYRQK